MTRLHQSGNLRPPYLWQGMPMLILTRRIGETLKIGPAVSVTVLSIQGNQVRIGINAPKDVAVHREEIYNRIANASNPSEEHS